MSAPTDLIIITTYFNPFRFRTRRNNFELFRANMQKAGVKFLTIEIAYGKEPFELAEQSEVTQIRSPDILWNKERIINHILPTLAKNYSKVVWLDCDIIFDSPDWPTKISKLLDSVPIAHVFSRARIQLPGNVEQPIVESSIAAFAKGSLANSRVGFGWAARTEFLEKIRLYDPLIVGGGAMALFFGLMRSKVASFEWAKSALEIALFKQMSSELSRDYTTWVSSVTEALNGSEPGYADNSIQVLWHSELFNLDKRAELYSQLEPSRDLVIGEEGCWRLQNSALRQRACELLMLREEDG